ncbi:MAG: hypothetical protein AMK75_00965 [Planctomycetes bacterium SM23_65]|nr:MAG: hypothetical protein AMK75_00965 [Planctomycetes bacterium SM23_65]
MNCRTICDHLSAYLDGELEAELAREVKAHLDSCERCREELDSLRELTGMLHALPRERAPEEIEREVVSYIEEDILLRKPRHRRWVVVAVKALAGLGVAAAVFLVAFSVYIYFAPYEPTPPEMMVASKSALDAKHGATDWKGGTVGPEASYGMADTADTRRQQQQPGTTTLAYRNGRATWDTSGARTKTGAVEGVQAVNGKLQVGETPGQLKPEDQPRGVVGTDLAHRRPSVTEVGKRVVPDTATPPRFAAPTLEMDRLAGATPAAKKKPTEPEFLNLVLEDDDFAAATQHIKTVAASLDIRSVDVGVEGTESLRRLILHAYFGETGRDTGKDESVLEREPVPKDKYRGDKVVEKELPAVVLVVEEEKLPGLVARLAVPRPRREVRPTSRTRKKPKTRGRSPRKT